MTNTWNRIIYRLWSPIYDATIGRLFLAGRKQAIRLVAPKPGERILLVGVGTGADIPLLPPGCDVLGIDLSPEMLRRAKNRNLVGHRSLGWIQGDAQYLLVEPERFDVVIFNLILSVIPDGTRCLQQNLLALKPHGRAIVFDKFAPEGANLSIVRRSLNIFSTVFGTDLTRRLGDMLQNSGATEVTREASILKGQYQVVLLRKS